MGWTGLVLATVACGAEVDLPAPPHAPESAAARAEYDQPTGSIDPNRIVETAEEVRARIEQLDIDWFPALVGDLLEALGRRFDADSLPTDPAAPRDSDRARIDAVIRLRRICSGWGEQPVNDVEVNGLLEITAVIRDTRLTPALWATATRCQISWDLADSTLHLMIDGTLVIYLYERLPQAERMSDFWVGYTGELGRAGSTRPLQIDFRARAGGLELRHAVDDGNIIVRISPSGFSLRGQNTTATCTLAPLTCENELQK